MKTYRSNGKLLLTGEYAVLDGTLSLALPTQKGQTLSVSPHNDGFLWRSYDLHGTLWFESHDLKNETGELATVAQTLLKILNTATKLNPSFSESLKNVCVETHLDFERNWGLGSSSTLINNIAMWAEVNPFELLFKSFGGSGYDIACATAQSAVLYRLKEGEPKTYPIHFQPSFSDKLFFVHLNQKQNSKEGIALYKSIKKGKTNLCSQLTEITEELLRFPSEKEFCSLLERHEEILANFLDIPTVKSLEFPRFEGTIKSLGAWGGDFVIAIGESAYVNHYFSSKNFRTIIPYNEMILK
ncbi:GYDIA family GHMP kinase [Capnocytophaga sp.]|uniref:GYDIA family GHMP kinase n=1 Tax=Capnocytophaga sp. TaxID=44737 RepID=UPI0026DDB29D|nr:GYDIA family GHMP kinase [Capnocytophaga sp.]MDO5106457.1 GYDIA family GHMP kinase [Capnocytophaga sp.]